MKQLLRRTPVFTKNRLLLLLFYFQYVFAMIEFLPVTAIITFMYLSFFCQSSSTE